MYVPMTWGHENVLGPVIQHFMLTSEAEHDIFFAMKAHHQLYKWYTFDGNIVHGSDPDLYYLMILLKVLQVCICIREHGNVLYLGDGQ